MNRDLSPAVLRQIQEAIQRGDKIGAIKIFREASGCDLKTSKEAVEVLMSLNPGPGAPIPLGAPSTPAARDLGPAARDRVIEALRQGNLIEAVKRYREATGLGLAESKAAVEAMQRNLNTGRPGGAPLPAATASPMAHRDPFEKRGCFGVVLVGILVTVWLLA